MQCVAEAVRSAGRVSLLFADVDLQWMIIIQSQNCYW